MRTRRLNCLWLLSVLSAAAFPTTGTPGFALSVFKARRDAVLRRMEPGSLAIFFTNPQRNRNNDVDFRFRADSNFLYLTGCQEPNSALVLVKDGLAVKNTRIQELLFVPKADAGYAQWNGAQLGVEGATNKLGLEYAVPSHEFADWLPKIAAAASTRKILLARVPESPSRDLKRMVDAFDAWREKDGKDFSISRPDRIMAELRQIKSADEIAIIKKCVGITCKAIRKAMQASRPGVNERELSALVYYVFALGGAEYHGYPNIVGSGPNSCVLHYMDNSRQAQSGEVICMDVGAEYNGYSADVTRTFPVNGKFTPEQRAIYQIVLKAQEAAIRECKAGNSFGAPHKAAQDILGDGLTKLGIIKNKSELWRYFPHGTSHYIGLDVHDAGLGGSLQPGMTLTVEPGCYIPAGSPCDKKWWNIGIRIEDDVLITKEGPLVMSADAPKQIAEIEALMRKPATRKR